MAEKYIWGGGTSSPDKITNKKLNDNVEYLEELSAQASAMGNQFGVNEDGIAGLDFAYAAGMFRNDNVITSIPSGIVILTDDATNYVEVDASGVHVNTNGFTSGRTPLYVVTTTNGTIDNIEDKRSWAFLADSPGDMLKSVYDTDNSGVVDYAEGVEWSDVDNKPNNFTPSAHAASHALNGSDELSLSAEQIVSDTMDVARLPVMTGATSIVAGGSGVIPSPAAGDDSKVLYGDGTWKTPPGATGTVSSVNGRTGAVTLDNTDVGLDNVTNDAQIPLSALDTDSTFAANSDTRVPSQKAVRTAFSNTLKMTDSQTQNRVLAAPVSANGAPSFRALDIADLPFVDNDGDLTADSDNKLATQKAVKYYVDNNDGGGGGGISKVEDDATPKLGGQLDANSKKIINLAAPTNNADAATKKYVDDNLNPLTLGETSSTAYRGDRGKTAYDHSQLTSGNPHGVTKSDVGLSNVTNDAQLKASALDTDANLTANSDTKVPSQKAVKAYVDANAGGGGGDSAPPIIVPNVAVGKWLAQQELIESPDKDDPPNGFAGTVWAPELGMFCAIGWSENSSFTSTDGVNWVEHSISGTAVWQNIAWSPKLKMFIAVGIDIDNPSVTCARSNDGKTWTPISSVLGRNVIWVEELSKFVVVFERDSYTSSDGINWDSHSLESAAQYYGLAWSQELGLICAIDNNGFGSDSFKVATSEDGETWNTYNISAKEGYPSMVWASHLQKFVAVGANRSSNTGKIIVSSDGENWSTAKTDSSPFFSVVYCAELGLVAAAHAGGQILYSADLENWETQTLSHSTRSVGWSPDLGVVAASNINCSISAHTYPYLWKPTTPEDWDNEPSSFGEALDELASKEGADAPHQLPRVQTVGSAGEITPDADAYDAIHITALAASLELKNPTGGADGQRLLLRIKDDGTSRSLTWGAAYRGVMGNTLPSATDANATAYIGFIYNENESKWDLVAV